MQRWGCIQISLCRVLKHTHTLKHTAVCIKIAGVCASTHWDEEKGVWCKSSARFSAPWRRGWVVHPVVSSASSPSLIPSLLFSHIYPFYCPILALIVFNLSFFFFLSCFLSDRKVSSVLFLSILFWPLLLCFTPCVSPLLFWCLIFPHSFHLYLSPPSCLNILHSHSSVSAWGWTCCEAVTVSTTLENSAFLIRNSAEFFKTA